MTNRHCVLLLAAALVAAGVPRPVSAQEEKPKASLKEQLAGTWKGMAGNDEIKITFTADGNYSLVADGHPDKGTWKLDDSTKPAKLDLNSAEEGLGYSIVEIGADGKMRITEPKKKEELRAKDFETKPNDVATLSKLDGSEPTVEKPEKPDPKVGEKLVGEWEGEMGKQKLHFSFNAEGSFLIVLKRANGTDKKTVGSYETDAGTWPYGIILTPKGESAEKEKATARFAFDSAGNLHITEPTGNKEKAQKALDDFDSTEKVVFKKAAKAGGEDPSEKK